MFVGAGNCWWTGALGATLSVLDTSVDGTRAAGVGIDGGSMRVGAEDPRRGSWPSTSPGETRSSPRSAFGPVGGKVERPGGILDLGAVGTAAIVPVFADVTDAIEAAGAVCGAGAVWEGLDGATGAALCLVSGIGALQTLDPPNAGIEAGGDEARGAYLSLDASARLASKASSLPGSRRASFADMGSIARDERLGYESTWGPSRSDGDAWWDEWGVSPVGVPGR
jgi:hypothetical protein